MAGPRPRGLGRRVVPSSRVAAHARTDTSSFQCTSWHRPHDGSGQQRQSVPVPSRYSQPAACAAHWIPSMRAVPKVACRQDSNCWPGPGPGRILSDWAAVPEGGVGQSPLSAATPGRPPFCPGTASTDAQVDLR